MKKVNFIKIIPLIFTVILFFFSHIVNAGISTEVKRGCGFISMFQGMKSYVKKHNLQGEIANNIILTNSFNLALKNGFLIQQGKKLKSQIIPLHSVLFLDQEGNLCFRSGKSGIPKTIINKKIVTITEDILPTPSFSTQVSLNKENFIPASGFTLKVKISEEPANIIEAENNNINLINIEVADVNSKTESFDQETSNMSATEKQEIVNRTRKSDEKVVRKNNLLNIKLAEKKSKEAKKVKQNYWDSSATIANEKQKIIDRKNLESWEVVYKNNRVALKEAEKKSKEKQKALLRKRKEDGKALQKSNLESYKRGQVQEKEKKKIKRAYEDSLAKKAKEEQNLKKKD